MASAIPPSKDLSMKLKWRCSIVCVVVVAMASVTGARPAHKKALADFLGPALPQHLNDCRTCHLPDKPGAKEKAKPHNLFGARLQAVRKELHKAGKDLSIAARLMAIADEDSDGDGVPNLLELLAGRNPGEAQDRPTALELARGKRLLAAWRARKPYDWKPFETV